MIGGDLHTLGKFVAPYDTVSGATVYLRSLKVAEYIDLSHRGFFRGTGEKAFERLQIVLACIQGWDSETMRDYEGWPVDELVDELIDMQEVIRISQFILDHLTNLSEEEEEKLRGYTRYLHEMSDPKKSKTAESFKCQNCILYGKYQSRQKFCGRFTPEAAASYKRRLEEAKTQQDIENVELVTQMMIDEQAELDKLERVAETAGKYGSASRRGRRRASSSKARPAKLQYMVINKFKFPQCPVSWIDDWIWVSGNIMYHSEKSNMPMFDGGMFDQPYKLYRAARVISSEFATIDEEERNKK